MKNSLKLYIYEEQIYVNSFSANVLGRFLDGTNGR